MNVPNSSLESPHFPVMLNEVIKICAPSEGGKYIDCTFGGGSYSKALLKFPNTEVIAIDRDKFVLDTSMFAVDDDVVDLINIERPLKDDLV